ncbi:MAG: hypothetical protein IIW66_02115 [Bacteroidales bacterium]|nr:hypothetical protein [Bacteroidales bacterium]
MRGKKLPEIIEKIWEEYIASGVDILSIKNTKENSISSLLVSGGCSQSGTPTPSAPATITSNKGGIYVKDTELPQGYARLSGIVMNDDTYYTIEGFRLRGSDTLKVSFTANNACNVVGCYTTANAQDNYSIFASTTSGAKYLRYNGGTYLSAITTGQRYDITITPTGATGFGSASKWTEANFETSVDMLIGSTSIEATSSKMTGTIHSTIEVVGRAKFIPCKRVSDGVIGYYDTYSEVFYAPTVGVPVAEGYDTSHVSGLLYTSKDIVRVGSINLNEGVLEHKGYNSTGSTSSSTTFCGTLHKISVNQGQKYTVSFGGFEDAISGVFVSTWNTDGSWNMRQAISSSGKLTYIIPEGVGEVNFTLYKTGGVTINEGAWLQVEYGDTVSDYEPYALYGNAEADLLLSIGNYVDTQDVISGVITRNVGVKVLNGTEDKWYKGSNLDAAGNSAFYLAVDDRANMDTSLKLLSSHYAFKGTVSYSTLKTGEMSITQTTKNIYFDGGGMTTVDEWKNYLTEQYASGTPIIVIYPLDTSTTENVSPQAIKNSAGDVTFFRNAPISSMQFDVTCKVKKAQEPAVKEITFNAYIPIEHMGGLGGSGVAGDENQTFTAIEGMTWLEYLNNDAYGYTSPFYTFNNLEDDEVCVSDGAMWLPQDLLITLNGEYVKASDKIVANAQYSYEGRM